MKNVFVTGASSGIGAAIARRSLGKDWRVFLGYRHGREAAEKIVQDIRSQGGQAWPVAMDLNDLSSLAGALQSIASVAESLNALVLCASPAPSLNSFTKTGAEEFLLQLNANVIGNHYLIMETWKRFFSLNGGGHVLAILSSAMGPPPRPHMTSYVVAKRGLQTVLECALAEFGSAGLRATAFCPSYTDTPMLRGFHPHVLAAIQAAASGKRLLTPEEVADRAWLSLERPPREAALDLQTLLPDSPSHG